MRFLIHIHLFNAFVTHTLSILHHLLIFENPPQVNKCLTLYILHLIDPLAIRMSCFPLKFSKKKHTYIHIHIYIAQ